MLCGPMAARSATGVPVETFVRHIRWQREQKGQRVSLRGGTTVPELRAALKDEDWCVHRVFQRRRIRLKDLKGLTGRWIFHQRDHFFGVRSGARLAELAKQHPTAIVTAGYIVHRRKA